MNDTAHIVCKCRVVRSDLLRSHVVSFLPKVSKVGTFAFKISLLSDWKTHQKHARATHFEPELLHCSITFCGWPVMLLIILGSEHDAMVSFMHRACWKRYVRLGMFKIVNFVITYNR